MAKQLKAAAKIAKDNDEPLVVVTHSFGSAIFYDLITSTELAKMPVRLWVMAGAGLVIRGNGNLPHQSQIDARPTSQAGERPDLAQFLRIRADLFSFQAEPVFENNAVRDIRMTGKSPIQKAHSAYFTEIPFYEEIAKALKDESG